MAKDFLKNPRLLNAGMAIAALLSFATILALFVQRDQISIARHQDAARIISAQYGRRLEETLQHSLSANYALAAVVRQNRGMPKDFDRLADELLVVYPALKALQLAPEGIIRKIHPLPGNEKVLDHDVLGDPTQGKDAIAAVRARRMTIAGPFELIQGGFGVVGRLPIFLPDERGSDKFWGFATSVIPTGDLLRAARLHELAEQGFSFALWRPDPETGLRQVISASSPAPLRRPISTTIAVPNGTWFLDLSPERGWKGLAATDWMIAIVMATLAATLAFMAVRWPARLGAEVRRQTAALQASEDKFRTIADFTYDWEYWADADGRIIYMTPSSARFTGYSSSAFEDDPGLLAAIVHEDDRHIWHQHARASVDPACRDEPGGLEFRIRARSGEIRWLAHVCQPIYGPDGAYRGRRASNRNITARKEVESALSAQLAFDRALLDAQSDADIGLVVVEGGRITYANDAIARIYRCSVDDIKASESFFALVHPDDRARVEENHRRRLAGEKLENRYDFRIVRRDGSCGTVELSVALIPQDANEPSVCCVFVDITERVRFEEDLMAAKQAAETANAAKSAFLANMSHELRTPMHAILSFASLGESRARTSPPETLEKYFNRVRVSGERLLGLLNDLLDLSKLEAGRMIMDFRPADLRQLLANVLADFGPLAAGKALQLELSVEIGDPAVTIDSLRITQVVQNFLSNAVKFTPAGGRIEVRLREAEITGRRHDDHWRIPAVAIEVRDSGVGIPEDELEAVFDKFVQSSKTRTGAGGTGLGLAICREIADAHHGTATARNNPDGGVTMTLTLPRSQTATIQGDKS